MIARPLLAYPTAGDAALERMIEARVALRAEADALHWRARLVVIEALVTALGILAAQLALGVPPLRATAVAAFIGSTCLIGAATLAALSGGIGLLLSHLRRRWAR